MKWKHEWVDAYGQAGIYKSQYFDINHRKLVFEPIIYIPALNKKMWADDQKTNIFRVFGSFLHYREWRPGRNLDRIPRTFSDDDYFKDALTNGGGTLVTFYTRLHKGKKADSFIVFENGKPMDFKTANQRGIKEIVEYVKKSVALNIKDDTN